MMTVLGLMIGISMGSSGGGGRVPGRFLEKTLAGLAKNTLAFTVPWAVTICGEGEMIIDTSFLFENKRFGTLELRVMRAKGGFFASLPDDSRWRWRYSKWKCPQLGSRYAPIIGFASYNPRSFSRVLISY